MPGRRSHRLILFTLLMVMADLRPCLAHQVMIVQGSTLEAYQRATSGFNQVFATISLPGVASIQAVQTVVLDPAADNNVQSVAQKYQDLQPNLIVAVGSPALEAVKDLVCPIVYLMTPNPEAIVRPRPTITGVKMLTSPEAQLSAIKATFPTIKKIGLIHNPASSGDFSSLIQTVAARLQLTLIEVAAVSDRESILRLTDLAAQLDAMLLTPDPAIISPSLLEALTLVSLEKKIPLIAFAPKYLDQGAALAIFTTPEQIGRQAAELAKRFLAAPAQGEIKPEYGKEATVLTNARIIEKLGLVSASPQERKAP